MKLKMILTPSWNTKIVNFSLNSFKIFFDKSKIHIFILKYCPQKAKKYIFNCVRKTQKKNLFLNFLFKRKKTQKLSAWRICFFWWAVIFFKVFKFFYKWFLFQKQNVPFKKHSNMPPPIIKERGLIFFKPWRFQSTLYFQLQ